MSSLSKLKAITTRDDRVSLLVLLVMSIILSLIEMVGISAIMPFITLASNPEKLFKYEYSRIVYDFFEFNSTTNFIISFGVLLIVFYLFRAIYSMIFNYMLNKFSFGRFHIFAFRLFKNYTNLPYEEFVKRNSAELTKKIVNETSYLSSYINRGLTLVSEFFTMIFLYILLFFVNWEMTLLLSTFIGLMVLLLIFSLKNRIKFQGEKRATLQSKFYKVLNETFGNFKLIKFIQNEERIHKEFSDASYGFARSNIVNNTLNIIPRLSLETVAFGLLISIVIYVLYVYEDPGFVLPIISMYALALYRMLPAINRIITNYNQIIFYSKSLDIMHEELSYTFPIEGKENIDFKDKIELKNISFEYVESKPVLQDINLTINQGDKIAFVGKSGSGKSTLVDLIIGLYKPLNGEIYIDDIKVTSENIKSFRSKIGYIPQSIYLFDGTVGENIAFGYEYDESKIIDVLKKANVYEFLITKEGASTKVGDGGIQLSGGQKQRIGIARALYSNPEILVLDEATSALDNDTEAIIMDEIYEISKERTLFIIAHRLSTVEQCERKIKLENGKVLY